MNDELLDSNTPKRVKDVFELFNNQIVEPFFDLAEEKPDYQEIRSMCKDLTDILHATNNTYLSKLSYTAEGIPISTTWTNIEIVDYDEYSKRLVFRGDTMFSVFSTTDLPLKDFISQVSQHTTIFDNLTVGEIVDMMLEVNERYKDFLNFKVPLLSKLWKMINKNYDIAKDVKITVTKGVFFLRVKRPNEVINLVEVDQTVSFIHSIPPGGIDLSVYDKTKNQNITE